MTDQEVVLVVGILLGLFLAVAGMSLFNCLLKPCCCPNLGKRTKKKKKAGTEQDPDCFSCATCCPCTAPPPEPPKEDVLLHMEDVTADELEDDFVNSGVIEDISIMVAIDMTRSNHFKGRKCFGGKSLHFVDETIAVDAQGVRNHQGELNPYERAILAAEFFLNTDRDFPLYYFGSVQAAELGGYVHVKDCHNYMDLWHTYRETAKTQDLSGPGRFLPILERAMERVRKLNRYHILFILTDGDIEDEEEFGEHLARASQTLPLSVVVVGVGDGPFHQIEKFDDYMPENQFFDNMQFVAFSAVHEKISLETQKKEFFVQAFNEIPRQYRMCKKVLKYRAPMRRVGTFEEPIHMKDTLERMNLHTQPVDRKAMEDHHAAEQERKSSRNQSSGADKGRRPDYSTSKDSVKAKQPQRAGGGLVRRQSLESPRRTRGRRYE